MKRLIYITLVMVLIFNNGIPQDVELKFSNGHSQPVQVIKLTPDEKYMLTGAFDGNVKLWEIESGKELWTSDFHSYAVTAIEISNNGQNYLSGSGAATGDIYYSEVKSGKLIKTFKSPSLKLGKVYDLKFSPKEQGFYSIHMFGLAFWKLTSSKPKILYNGFSSDGAISSKLDFYVVHDSKKKVLMVNDINGNKVIKLFPTFKSLSKISISPSGRFLANYHHEAGVQIYEISTGKEIEIESIAFNVEFSNDDSKVIITKMGGVEYWDTNDWTFETFKIPQIFTSTFSKNDKSIFLARHAIINFNLIDKDTISQYKGVSNIVWSSRYLNETNLLLETSEGLKIWDIKNNGTKFYPHRYYGPQSILSTKPVGFVTVADTIKIFNTNEPNKFFNLISSQGINLQGSYTRSYDIDSESGLLAIVKGYKKDKLFHPVFLEIIDLHQKKIISSKRFNQGISRIKFIEDGNQILATTYPNEIKLLKTSDLTQVKNYRIPNLKDYVGPSFGSSLATHSKSNLLASGGLFLIAVWDLKTGKIIKKINTKEIVNHLEFADDPNTIVSASNSDPRIKIWNLKKGKVEKYLEGHKSGITSISFSDDYRFLISTSNDNTIKIWDFAKKELVGTLVHIYNVDWTVISKHGLFDASDEGMKELFFKSDESIIALDQLKDRYYEPGLLQKILGLSDEPLRKSRGLNNIELYPNIELIHPIENKGKLGIKLTNRGGGIGKVLVWINGKEITTDARGKGVDPDDNEIIISYDINNHPYLKSGDVNEIEVKAYNKEEYLVSRGKKLYYIDHGKKEDYQPSLHAIIIGTSNYNGDELDLKYAAKDAEDFAKALELTANQYFRKDKVDITLFSTENADFSKWPTKVNIEWAFAEVSTTANPSDVLVVYLAGHGVNYGGSEGDFYYLTSEASNGKLTDPVVRDQVAISSNELTELIKTIPALKQVLILDACHSGIVAEDLMTSRTGRPSSEIRALERMKDRTGMYVLAGSAADAVSYEASVYGQGLLTYSLLFGMKGAALRENKFVDIMKLFQFAADKVPELAENIGGVQKPEIRVPYQAQSFDIGISTEEVQNQIILPSPKPLFLRSNFTNEITFNDNLRLSESINDELINIQTRDENEVIFIDASRFSDAYSLKGRYQKNGDAYTVQVRLFKGDEVVESYEVNGKEVIELTRLIIDNALGQIKP